ncbi:MAG TPA: class I SAM-dependent methyltransferase [Alphaproteobacteria bacterium]|jgi:SAM-dependent methyltransferase
MTAQSVHPLELPGSELDVAKMPGHWLLARLGKRVLRPGGLGMTRALLDDLSITAEDDVVEFAPGLGTTARQLLDLGPRRYTGVERDAKAAACAERHLPKAANIAVVVGTADHTRLPDACASVVLGEAMLTMNTAEHKRRIVEEAHRLLRPGGRYAIHELCIVPDEMAAAEHRQIERDLSSVIHVGARPLRTPEWRDLLERSGFRVARMGHAPMHLLRPKRLIEDEGLIGALRIAKNVALDPKARQRVLAMRRVFERYRSNLKAIYIVAEKRDAAA